MTNLLTEIHIPHPVNLASYLHEKAELLPHKRAVVFPQSRDCFGHVAYTHLTFRQLREETDRLCHGLARVGITRGTKTVLMVKPSLEFFSLTFALWKAGAVLVMVDPGIGLGNLKTCLQEAQPEAFIGISKAHAARVLLRWSPDTIKTCVTVGSRWFWGGYSYQDIREDPWKPFPIADTQPDEMAGIMFTSGSTGIAKGAVYTHGVFAHQVKFLQEIYQFSQDEIDLATFPLFALFDIALGMTAIVPDMDASKPAQADPVKLIESIENHGATMMFGSPALVNTLSRYGEPRGIKLLSLKRVISCGAPARNDVLRRFQKMLSPDAQIFTPYGATESLPVSSIGSHEILDETHLETAQGGGNCIGLPIPRVVVNIIRITDDPIEVWSDELLVQPGEIGEVVVKGPIVTREYYRRPEATRQAKIISTDGQETYHRMGDVGRIDDKGRLWFCGRKSHRVETASGTLFTIPCEAIFNQHSQVYRSALVGIGKQGEKTPVMCIELEKGLSPLDFDQLRKTLFELGARYPHTKNIKQILLHPEFPVDIRHNAKIGREKLAEWAFDQLKQSSR